MVEITKQNTCYCWISIVKNLHFFYDKKSFSPQYELIKFYSGVLVIFLSIRVSQFFCFLFATHFFLKFFFLAMFSKKVYKKCCSTWFFTILNLYSRSSRFFNLTLPNFSPFLPFFWGEKCRIHFSNDSAYIITISRLLLQSFFRFLLKVMMMTISILSRKRFIQVYKISTESCKEKNVVCTTCLW